MITPTSGRQDAIDKTSEEVMGLMKKPKIVDVEVLPLTSEELDEELFEVDKSNPGWREIQDGYIKVKSVFDSGVAESVAPRSMAPAIPIVESPGSKRGQHYKCAGKVRVPNRGQQEVNAITKDFSRASLCYQIADISRPLTAAGDTCDKGNIVVLTSQGGLIYNLANGHTTDIERRAGIYELDFWILGHPGFTWQGS